MKADAFNLRRSTVPWKDALRVAQFPEYLQFQAFVVLRKRPDGSSACLSDLAAAEVRGSLSSFSRSIYLFLDRLMRSSPRINFAWHSSGGQ